MYAIAGDAIVMRKLGSAFDPLFTAKEARALAPAQESVFLGLENGAPRHVLALERLRLTV